MDEYTDWVPFTSCRGVNRDVWKHFLVMSRFGTVIKTKVKCQLCKRVVSWNGSTGNVKKHLLHNHPQDLIQGPSQFITTHSYRDDSGCEWTTGYLLNRRLKDEIWKHFMVNTFQGKIFSRLVVKCKCCGQDISWKGKGLEKVKKHFTARHSVLTTTSPT